ncbi:WD repeat-containing protein [Reticulomyxa filosa]|uniref:WD repeat-containing protein n=1 Tax=Reticulomyxa filosa TaxID=46433 RepID=X6MCH4_RETFI|nr:WD repeat-containing protein [Reticulomyxa filosa]|eukprot:ETO11718.1 WD repeat-containing protein [Reticulomyxa filosa]
MGNQNKSQTSITTAPVQTLNTLPTPLSQSQCVLHKQEILICGGVDKRAYDVKLEGHCVVKLVNHRSNDKDSSEVTLLSFGGKEKHTLVMKYVSVWNNYQGMRAVIGGSNNHLLFITYYPKNISVFDLNTFQFIKHSTLLTSNYAWYHCFVSKSENGKEVKNKNNEMLLFCGNIGLSIEYYEVNKNEWMTFENILPIPLYDCFGILNEDNSHVHIIGGESPVSSAHMKAKVSEWRNALHLVIFISTLLFIFIFYFSKNELKLVIQYWIRILKIKLGWINEFNKIIIRYIRGFELLMVLQAHDDTVSSVGFSADGRKIVSASYDNTIRIWEVASGKQLQIFRGHTSRVFASRFSPDRHTVVSCAGDGTIRLWDVNTGNEVMKFKDLDKIWDVNFSPDGKYVVSGLQDSTVRLFDVHSGIEMKLLLGHSKDVVSTQFSPDGKMIVSSSNDKTVGVWNVESGEILKQFKGYDRIIRVNFSPDGQFIISGSLGNIIRIWNAKTEKEHKILKGHSNHVNDVKYFPDGRTIVSCSSDNTIRLWNVESGQKIQMLEGHSDCVKSVDVSQNGDTIVSGSADCKIRIWG